MVMILFVLVRMMAHIILDLFLPDTYIWQSQNFNRFVIDNNEDYYIVKSVNSKKICDEIRKNNMDFTS